MKHTLPPLDALKVFESAARHLSFTRAADELCVTKSAVGYQIRKLEEHLGLTLFKRNVRQVLLTDSGQILLQATQKVFSDLGTTLRFLPKSTATVTVAATTYVAARLLSPVVAGFAKHHPDVSVVFQHGVYDTSFGPDQVDITIRWGPCHGRINEQRLAEFPMALFPVCNAELKQRLDDPSSLESIHTLPLLCEDRAQDLWQEWAGADLTLDENPRHVIADANVRVQAAIDGQGLILADALMQAEISSGALIAPFKKQLTGYGYGVITSGCRSKNPEPASFQRYLLRKLECAPQPAIALRSRPG